MSVFLSHFYLYMVDDNYFRFKTIKENIQQLDIPSDSIMMLKPKQMDEIFAKYQTDINDIFLFSTDMNTKRSFTLAKLLRNQCKRCQIAFYGTDVSDIRAEKLNYLSALGVIDLNIDDYMSQLHNLLIEAFSVKKERLHEKRIIPIYNRKELYFFDSDCVNYITTIKGERNRVEIHQSKAIDHIHTAIKEVKKIDLPDYFLIFKFYIINTRQIKKLDRKTHTLFFFSGEQLEVGNRISKAVLQKLLA